MNGHVYLRLWGYLKGNDPARVRVQTIPWRLCSPVFLQQRVVREWHNVGSPLANCPVKVSEGAELYYAGGIARTTDKEPSSHLVRYYEADTGSRDGIFDARARQ